MAIKVKKKSQEAISDSEETNVEVLDSDGSSPTGGPTPDLGVNYDSFEHASIKTVAWVEQNRNLIIGLLVAGVVGIVGVFAAISYIQQKETDASMILSEGINSYESFIAGSPEMEQITSNPDLADPKLVFDSAEQKWQKIYDQANATLSRYSTGSIARTAQLTKAAAAMELGKFEEASSLYESYIGGGNVAEEVLPVVYQGLVNSYLAQEQYDKALSQLEKLDASSNQAAMLVLYEKGRIKERSGDIEGAKTHYHELLENFPGTEYRADVERRLAIL